MLNSEKMERCVVTGAAGFIGSHILEALLSCGKCVVGVDDFSTGCPENVEKALALLSADKRERFSLVEGDVRSLEVCLAACKGASTVYHNAALVPVPLSLERPRETFEINSIGFFNVLEAARAYGCRIVYASSGAVYGDHPELPKREDSPLKPLSPYALSKIENERWADLYWRLYGVRCVGLRYFNIYGPRQNAKGNYSAVIPAWADALRSGERVKVYGDGSNTRDFCYIGDVVQANLLAGSCRNPQIFGEVFNIAAGVSVSLLGLYDVLRRIANTGEFDPVFVSPRRGDVLHSVADITKARRLLGYAPCFSLEEGVRSLIFSD